MLKQLRYIKWGLQDMSKCVYYVQHKDNGNYVVFLDSNNCENVNLPIYGIVFEDDNSAAYFAHFNIKYDKKEFNIFVQRNGVIIEPKTIDGVLKIDCENDEMLARKLVKMFREQYVRKLDMCKQANKDKNVDFDILMY